MLKATFLYSVGFEMRMEMDMDGFVLGISTIKVYLVTVLVLELRFQGSLETIAQELKERLVARLSPCGRSFTLTTTQYNRLM